MSLDHKTIEELVEIITREVLLSIAEDQENQKLPEGAIVRWKLRMVSRYRPVLIMQAM